MLPTIVAARSAYLLYPSPYASGEDSSAAHMQYRNEYALTQVPVVSAA